MNGDPINLLIQGGLIGIFMVYVILTRRDDAKERNERNDSWQEFIATQNEITCANIKIMADALNKVVDKFDLHDKKNDTNFAVLIDRIKPTRKIG